MKEVERQAAIDQILAYVPDEGLHNLRNALATAYGKGYKQALLKNEQTWLDGYDAGKEGLPRSYEGVF